MEQLYHIIVAFPLVCCCPAKRKKNKKRRRKNPPLAHSSLACSITSYPNNERGKHNLYSGARLCCTGEVGGGKEGEGGKRRGGRRILESQFEEWLKSLDIKSGVWGLC